MNLLRQQPVLLKVHGVIQQAIEKPVRKRRSAPTSKPPSPLRFPPKASTTPSSTTPPLHEFLILSDLQITRGGDLSATVQESTHCKCGRCWKYLPDVGANAEHPTLCGRCVEAVG
ncbi:MAG: hypothetical protein J0L73_23350 [Verrucomicrobia bacterium]|nr:hypothetical protein [Verrucomicrobiota bacterium]